RSIAFTLRERTELNVPIWPVATHTDTNTYIPPITHSEAILPPFNFPAEIHNEDSHYTRLAIGFLLDSNNKKIPISFSDPELEPLVFSTPLECIFILLIHCNTKRYSGNSIQMSKYTL